MSLDVFIFAYDYIYNCLVFISLPNCICHIAILKDVVCVCHNIIKITYLF